MIRNVSGNSNPSGGGANKDNPMAVVIRIFWDFYFFDFYRIFLI